MWISLNPGKDPLTRTRALEDEFTHRGTSELWNMTTIQTGLLNSDKDTACRATPSPPSDHLSYPYSAAFLWQTSSLQQYCGQV